MSDLEKLESLLQQLNRTKKLKSVLASQLTEFNGEKLVSVDLSDLELDEVPSDCFSNFPDLQRIHLGFNNIASLDEGIFQSNPELTYISLYRNKLTELPDNIFSGLTKLQWLDLRSNALVAVPKSVGTLDSLEYLFLQNNPMSKHDGKWAADYHSKRDVKKFMDEFKKEMGL